jgi:hypothetical protein
LGTDWDHQHELALLDDDLKHIADQSRADETKKMVNAIERSVKKQLLEPVEVALSKPSPAMWETVLDTYRKVLDSAESAYLSKAKSECLSIKAHQVSAAPTRKTRGR